MAEQFLKKFISRFTEKNFSKDTELKFGYWLTQNKNDEELDASLYEIWNETPNQVNSETLEDLERLKAAMTKEQPKQKSRKLSISPLLKYAAVILLILATSITTYLVTQPAETTFTECTVSVGQQKIITLTDGSTISINAGSSLIYPEEFNGKTRTVFLSGEAIFRVAKNPKKPFIVKTSNIAVQALGTAFNIQAYPGFSHTTATLIEGKVRVTNNYSDEQRDLIPDQQYTFNNTSHEIAVKEVDAEKLSMWEKGYLVFQDVAFAEIIKTVERKYKVQIHYNFDQYKDFYCNIKFNPDETINDVMSILCGVTTKAKFTIHNNQVLILSE